MFRRHTPTLRVESLEPRQLMAAFTWEMAERFGLDQDGDGRTDMWHDAAFIQEDRFDVSFEASSSDTGDIVGDVDFAWEIGSIKDGLVATGRGETMPARLEAGQHFVRLTASGRDASGDSVEIVHPWEPIEVRDILILSMGDSYGSGEGNPERPRSSGQSVLWADECNDLAANASACSEVNDPLAGAHRSSLSASAVAALELERADPHTSVTYVSVAWTGARISGNSSRVRDLLGTTPTSNSQLQDARQLIGNRTIDTLVLSVGGNDIGFANIAKDLVLREGGIPFTPSLGDIESATNMAMAALPARYDMLATALRNTWISTGQLEAADVHLVEYADPTWDADGGTSEILDDLVTPLSIDPGEVEFARRVVVGPLAQTMQQAASRNGWSYVGGIANAFVGHGYAAEDPYDEDTPASRARWFRTATESREMQGPYQSGSEVGAIVGSIATVFGGIGGVLVGITAAQLTEVLDETKTLGTLHPNELGHAAMGSILAAQVRPTLELPVDGPYGTALARPPYVQRLVPIEDGFRLEFSEPVWTYSVLEELSVAHADGSSVDWDVAPALSGFVSSLRVSLNEATPTGYQVSLASSVVDRDGDELNQDRDQTYGESPDDDFVWQDHTGPRGVGYQLPAYETVRVRFNEAIDARSFTARQVAVTDVNGQSHAGLSALSVDAVPGGQNRAFDVRLSQFPAGGVRLVVDSSVRDMVGIALDQDEDDRPGEAQDDWEISHVDMTPPTAQGIALARESRVVLGGGTALVFMSFDEPILMADLQSAVSMTHQDGRAATLVSVREAASGVVAQGSAYLLEFDVPDLGDYTLQLAAGVRDWFQNATTQGETFSLTFRLHARPDSGLTGLPPDERLSRPLPPWEIDEPWLPEMVGNPPVVIPGDWVSELPFKTESIGEGPPDPVDAALSEFEKGVGLDVPPVLESGLKFGGDEVFREEGLLFPWQ